MDTGMKTASKNQQVLSEIKEDLLCLEMSPVDKSTGDREIEECNAHLFINGQHINHGIVEVKMTAMDQLQVAAMALKTSDLNFVTGLKMHLIVENGQVNLLYRPVFMKRPASPYAIGEPFYNVTEGVCYKYDTVLKVFTEVSSRIATTLMAAYREQIRIKHRIDTVPTPFIPDFDTESIIFPFQTIYELAKDNDSDSIFIHNSIRQESVGGGYSIKHCLLLSSVFLTSNSFTGKFANRSHLCPPSCNVVQYALARIV